MLENTWKKNSGERKVLEIPTDRRTDRHTDSFAFD